MPPTSATPEHVRLEEARTGAVPWKAWGPYLSERQWGTVREDYSAGGDAWDYFPHDQARSRAYRWGEDGIAGICDERQRLCLALALWNGADPILKERMFGLTNGEGNHGEDVKEYWFYLDSTPTHSYLKCLYKYPQRDVPVRRPGRRPTRARGKQDFEYELLDTGIFDEDRYFDVVVEYAKAAPDDILMLRHRAQPRPGRGDAAPAADAVVPQHVVVGRRRRRSPRWRADGGGGARRRTPSSASGCCTPTRSAELLFCENETNNERLFGAPNASPYVKDAINDYVVARRRRRGQPGAHGHQGRGASRAGARGRARAPRSACG